MITKCENCKKKLKKNEAKLYTKNKKYQPHLNEIWRRIAQRYKDEPYVAGYDLINEPVLTHGITMKELRDSFVSLTKAVRALPYSAVPFLSPSPCDQ